MSYFRSVPLALHRCDEFTATLDRTLAKVVAFNVRKQLARTGVGLLAATTHTDIIDDLRPDLLVRCERRNHRPNAPAWEPSAISFTGELSLAEGTHADWQHFARWHYRGSDLAFTRHIVLLRHRDEPIGICVFGAGRGVSLRSRYFGLPNPALLRRTHGAKPANVVTPARGPPPDLSGRGYGSAFVRRSVRVVPGKVDRDALRNGSREPLLREGRLHARGSGDNAQSESAERSGVAPVRRPPRTASPTAPPAQSDHSNPVYYVFDNRGRAAPTNP